MWITSLFLQFFVILSIVANGYLVLKFFYKIFKKSNKFNRIDSFLAALVFGSVLLVVPMFVLGVLTRRYMKSWVYFYFFLANIHTLYFIVKWIYAAQPTKIMNIQFRINKFVLGVALLFFELMIVNWMFPVRGWDALNYYLPSAYVFYLYDKIITINPLTFIPTFKELFHILLFTYAYYITSGENIQLIPILFLLGITLLTWRFAGEMGFDEISKIFSTLAVLSAAITYLLIYSWPYYQELFIWYSYSQAIFSFYMFKSTSDWKHLFVAQGAMTIAVMAKLSGLTLFLMLLLIFPSKKSVRFLRLALLNALFIYLIYHSITTLYFGIGLFLIVPMAILNWMIYNENSTLANSSDGNSSIASNNNIIDQDKKIPLESSQITPTSKNNTMLVNGLDVVLVSFPAMIVSIAWFYFLLNKVPGATDYAFAYLLKRGSGIVWDYTLGDPTFVIIESATKLNFFAAILTIFTSLLFVLPWAIPKLQGIVDGIKEKSFLVSWIFVFTSIWSAYYINVSARYLVVIVIPLLVLTIKGFEKIVSDKSFFGDNTRFRKTFKKYRIVMLELFLITGYLTYLPLFVSLDLFSLLSGSFVSNAKFVVIDNLKILYLNFELLLLIILFFGVVYFFLPRLIAILDKKIATRTLEISPRHFKHLKIKISHVETILLIIILLPSLGSQLFLYARSNFDLETFHDNYFYEQRPEYRELIDYFKSVRPLYDAIISFDTPGLAYFTGHPTLDMIMINDDVFANLVPENTTKILEEMKKYHFRYLVTLKSNYLYSDRFVKTYYKYLFYRLIGFENATNKVFENSEYRVYHLFRYPMILPIVDLQVRDEQGNKASLLGQQDFQDKLDLTGNLTLRVILDQSWFLTDNATINLAVKLDKTWKNMSVSLVKTEKYKSVDLALLTSTLDDLYLQIKLEKFGKNYTYTLDELIPDESLVLLSGNTWHLSGTNGIFMRYTLDEA